MHTTADIQDWLQEARAQSRLLVQRIPLSRSGEWQATEGTIRHRTGRFFSVKAAVSVHEGRVIAQPILHQPEIGILGFLVRRTPAGVQVLCQAKTEPGNVHDTQLSPTFQATRSNYERLHGGAPQLYASYFLRPSAQWVVDQLQSEQGFRFWQKRNRNGVIEVDAPVEESPLHRWISLDWIMAHLADDYLFNTDFRSVFAQYYFGHLLPRQLGWDLTADLPALEEWLARQKESLGYQHSLTSLETLSDWTVADEGITHVQRNFGVRYYDVACACREVPHWDQPLMFAHQPDTNTLVFCRTEQGISLLLQLRPEPGVYDGAEFTCTHHSQDAVEEAFFPTQIDLHRRPLREVTRFHTSEEGGRFFHNRTENVLLESETAFMPGLPHYRWVSLREVCYLIHRSNRLTNELRTVLSALPGVLSASGIQLDTTRNRTVT